MKTVETETLCGGLESKTIFQKLDRDDFDRCIAFIKVLEEVISPICWIFYWMRYHITFGVMKIVDDPFFYRKRITISLYVLFFFFFDKVDAVIQL